MSDTETLESPPPPKPTGGQAIAGLTVRDWFAGQALAGFLASPNNDGTGQEFARWAYMYADAMLKERDKW